MKIAILILSVFSLLHIGCSINISNDEFVPHLPLITQTGENTFGCYINGVLVTPRDGTGSFNVEDKGMQFFAGPSSSDIKYHEIRVNDFASDKTSKIRIHIRGLDSIGVGIYIVNESNCQQGFQSLPTHNIHGRVYDFNESIYKKYCSLPNSGTITITRYDNGILSGTFSCRAANEDDPNDIVEITDGRFDLDLSRLQYEDFP